MAVLSDEKRLEVSHEFQQEVSNLTETLAVTKAQVLEAIILTDDFLEGQKTTFRAAVREAGSFTPEQQDRLFNHVANKRYAEGG